MAIPEIDGLSLHERIGRGGYASVWRATDDAFGRIVAVKVLDSKLSDDASAKRFERECRALGAVDGHPNIITTHRVGNTADGRPFLVMALEAGGSLEARLRHGVLQPDEVADIGSRIAGALATAHRAGVLHRDVKPDNILMDRDGTPKLTDFGIARITGAADTTTGVITASLAHAAPEVLDGRQPDERSDVYSLCSTLYALLTGSPPFFRAGEESVVPLITRILTEPPPVLSPRVPAPLARAIADGLVKDPTARIASAEELSDRFRTGGATAGTGTPDSAMQASPVSIAQPPPPPAPASFGAPPGYGAAVPPAGSSWAVPAILGGVVLAMVLAGLALYLNGREEATPVVSEPPATILQTLRPEASEPVAAPSPAEGDGQGTASTADLTRAALRVGDVLNSSLIDERVWESDSDGEQPLQNYAYCGATLDLSGVSRTAATVLSDDIQDGVFTLSFVAEAESEQTWNRVVDDIIASAQQCREFVSGNGLTTVFVDSATRTEDGALLEVHFESTTSLADVAPATSYIEIHGRYLVAVDLPEPLVDDADSVRQILRDRVAELPQ